MLMGGGRGVAVRQGDDRPPGGQADDVAPGGDFRAALYQRYVAGFKGEANLGGSGGGPVSWWDQKYLALLDGLGRSAPGLGTGRRPSGGLGWPWLCWCSAARGCRR